MIERGCRGIESTEILCRDRLPRGLGKIGIEVGGGHRPIALPRLQFEESGSANGAECSQRFSQGGVGMDLFDRFSAFPAEPEQEAGAVDLDMLLEQRCHASAAFVSRVALMAGAEMETIDKAGSV